MQGADLRVFVFVKDEGLNSICNDLHSFFNATLIDNNSSHHKPRHLQMSSQESTPFAKPKIDILSLPSDDIDQRTFTIDRIKFSKSFIVCATDISINSKIQDPKTSIGFTITQNQKCDLSNLITSLSSFGYIRTSFVADKTQFAVRGDILDIWPLANDMPIRVFFEYNVIGSLRIFDPVCQLSNTFIDNVRILPASPLECNSTIKDYFVPVSASVDYPLESKTSKHNTLLYFDYHIDKNMENLLNKYELLINDPLNIKTQYQGYKSFTKFQGNISFFVNSLKNFAENNVTIKIYCANNGEYNRIVDIFHETHWDYKNPEFLYGNLSRGFYLEKAKIACISSREMLYKKDYVNFPKLKGGKRLEGIGEISAGDYVVHEKYGIGRFVGLKTIFRNDNTSEYLCIEYKNFDKLYVPLEGIKTVKKYIGIEGVRPKLYSMDTLAWEKVKSRARKAAAEFAKELLKLYTQRSLVKRPAFGEKTTWEKELEDAFQYNETPDQIKAIADIKNDFCKPYPMERLICGDVGYGKTEVAVRAAFKVIQEGMQVVVLVPTIVLAQQHYNTFCNRLSMFPTKVAILSRFQAKPKQKEITQDLKKGLIDIIVGTHRLLQKDIQFKKLGLLIIDEEHRFGVKQKEKIKSIKKNIDILMLSATPIPRTLSSALTGFRDLSLMETPPFGRLPIETNVVFYDEKLIKDIIKAELSRNGQIFYVYNKIETILTKAESIKKLVPGIKLGIIHGKMKTKDIENIMWKFVNLELDILLATTIIESGLDIPSVNTMIIEEAENFGLSQLYQLRGRIGRNEKKAYCYLFYKDEILSNEAVKRLEAMKEFSELGSGFKLALKDLEIRGAGGILSANQHGFVRDIGYDLFAKLLKEEGKKIKGDEHVTTETEKVNAVIDLQVNALIPSTYIESEDMRILFYRKLANIKDIKSIEPIKNELLDRFGKIPKEVQMLFEITNLRLTAEKFGIEKIAEDNSYIYLYFLQKVDFSKTNITKLINDYSKVIEFISGKYYAFKLKKSMINEGTVKYLTQFLERLDFYMQIKPLQ
jgi:transcription-repair coupling factor (superfamily II helicase)